MNKLRQANKVDGLTNNTYLMFPSANRTVDLQDWFLKALIYS